MARKLSGEASAEELQQLNTYLREHQEDQYFFELLQNFWDQPKETTSSTEEEILNAHFEYIIHQAEEEINDSNVVVIPATKDTAVIPAKAIKAAGKKSTAKLLWIKRFSVAAAVCALLFGLHWLHHPNPESLSFVQNHKSEVSARMGAKSKILLPDGSTVWLNSGSKLTYSDNFRDTVRSVELEGEAFFDVVKDAKHPFIVHTSGIDIRVLGTAFNVKSYAAEATIEATLIRGLIEVVKKDEPGSPKVILRPHEKLVFNKEEQTLVKSSGIPDEMETAKPVSTPQGISIIPLPKNKPDTTLEETSWVYNKLIFDGDTFSELSGKMERWFNVRITFQYRKAEEYRVSGVFENESIDQALKALQLIVPFTYKINGNEIEIFKK
jgi:ferric-dicitrate binding protein FerR (iron transport regulator)